MEQGTMTAHDAGITITGRAHTPAALRINHISGAPIVTIHCDGRVDINPEFTTEDAALAFWAAVRQMNPRGPQ